MKKLVMVLMSAGLLFAAAGSLDRTFGEDGIVMTPISSDYDIAASVAIQKDGKIVVTGYSYNGRDYDLALVRYLSDGRLDHTFGIGGKVITPVGSGNDAGLSTVIQNDGKIVVGGYTAVGKFYDTMLVRFLPDGSLDPEFGEGGKVITAMSRETDTGLAVALQSNGRILIAGDIDNGGDYDFALMRFYPDGTIDPSFGDKGMVITPVGCGDDIGLAMTVQANDQIIVAGTANNSFALVRYEPDGSLDPMFGDKGKIVTVIPEHNAIGLSVALTNDDKIVVAGAASDNIAVAQYQKDGKLDALFGDDGIVITPVGCGDNYGFGVAAQEDDKIVVAGRAFNGGSYDFALIRYRSTGDLDYTFSGDGIILTSLGRGDDIAYALALQDDGAIIVAGSTFEGNTTQFDFAVVRYLAESEDVNRSLPARSLLDALK